MKADGLVVCTRVHTWKIIGIPTVFDDDIDQSRATSKKTGIESGGPVYVKSEISINVSTLEFYQ